MNVALRIAGAGLALSLLAVTGCGTPAAPQAPSLKLPEPVVDLTAQRIGNEVRLRWTMPRRTTDKVLLKGDQDVHVCRKLENGPCEAAGDLKAAPKLPAEFVDRLPGALVSGEARRLTYVVELKNRAGHDAGPSNPAYTDAGAPPSRVENLTAKAVPDGVLLEWRADGSDSLIRIHRELVAPPGAAAPASQAGPTPGSRLATEQMLEVEGANQGRALDRDAALDHTWRYTVERVVKVPFELHSYEILSAPSDAVTVDARDIFPPRPPTELQAVADPDARAIDLSWAPNTEGDLAGYVVYRRDAGSNGPATRISAGEVVAPSFRDPNPLPGRRYAYSVSAVDHDGNESGRSAEVEEALPQP